jgi:hypothetical protein
MDKNKKKIVSGVRLKLRCYVVGGCKYDVDWCLRFRRTRPKQCAVKITGSIDTVR